MNHRKALGRLTRLSLALSLLGAGSAMAEADRVLRGPVTTKTEVRGGVSGTLVTYTEYTYRKFSDQVASIFPNNSSGLTTTEMNYVLAMLNASGVSLSNANIQAVVNAVKNWKNGLVGSSYNFVNSSNKNNYLNTQTANLASAVSGALGLGSVPAALTNQANAVVAQVSSARGWYYSDPLVFDLNGNGKIDVTGVSASKHRALKNQVFVAAGSVKFDIQGNGKPVRIEWVKNGDGILVDNRKNAAKKLVAQGKPLSIKHLFGDTDGNTGGFMKLAREFNSNAKVAAASGVPADVGIIKGKDLEQMLMWIDNGDGKAQAKELHTLASLGITEIRLPHRFMHNEENELIERASFIRNGKSFIVDEIWFGREGDTPAAGK